MCMQGLTLDCIDLSFSLAWLVYIIKNEIPTSVVFGYENQGYARENGWDTNGQTWKGCRPSQVFRIVTGGRDNDEKWNLEYTR